MLKIALHLRMLPAGPFSAPDLVATLEPAGGTSVTEPRDEPREAGFRWVDEAAETVLFRVLDLDERLLDELLPCAWNIEVDVGRKVCHP